MAVATAAKGAPVKAKKKKKRTAYEPPSPYTFRGAVKEGDLFTRLSILVWGLGNMVRGQIIKGIAFLAVEAVFIAYFVSNGFAQIAKLGNLYGESQKKIKNDEGFWEYIEGDHSVTILLYGVAGIFAVLVFIWFWRIAVSSSYRAQKAAAASKTGKAPGFWAEFKSLFDERIPITLMSLPVLGVVLFTVLPLVFMISMAFTEYDSNHPDQFNWAGVNNFKAVLANNDGIVNFHLFMSVLLWTLIWAFFATFLNYFLGMFMAMIINRKSIKLKGLWRGIFSMSIAVPQFVSLLVMHTMLQPTGIVNRLLMENGWIDSPLPFFTDTNWARVTVIVINLWVGIPFTIMQVTGILQNIPAELYEAAKLDGANWWQQFRSITMPYMIFVTTPYLITTFTGNVNNFNVIYLLSSGDPTPVGSSAGKTDLLITWLYKLTVDKGNYNLGAVIGILTFIVLAVISLITYRSSGSYKNEGGYR